MKKLIMILLAVMFAFAGPATAQMRKKDIMNVPVIRWWLRPDIVKELSLTKQEIQQLDEAYNKTKMDLIDQYGKSKKAMLELEIEMRKENYDKDVSLELFKKVQDIKSVLAVDRFKYFMKTRDIINSQRFEQLKQIFIKEKRKLRQSRRTKKRAFQQGYS